MNKSERVEAGLKDFEGKDLAHIVEMLTDRVREKYPDPEEGRLRDNYNKIMRNSVAIEWLANADKKKLDRLDGLLDDYSAAQQIGKFIKLFCWAMVGMIGLIFSVVKAVPDVMTWLRGMLLK